MYTMASRQPFLQRSTYWTMS
ncbi:unnamed protein product [Linum tenue]|uniref:Uncharacterized protein n=1 Tax=Linum tenue TaxID=586396 RepID=A0AAV0J6P0_9ROSI|nr:unnamed protein product [Linum tenue]